MSKLETFDQEEISLRDLWRILVDQKKWVVGLPILCVILAGVVTFLSKPKWEATAVVQIGQVGESGAGQTLSLIEPPVRAIERMKMKSFEDDVIADLKMPINPGNPVTQLFRNSLSIKALGTTDLIQVRVRGYSQDQAGTWARAVVHSIKAVHEKLTHPAIERLNKQRDELRKQMQMIENERDNLSKIVSATAAKSGVSNFSENLLFSNLLVQKNAELRDFEMRLLAVNEQLTSIRAYPTSLVDRVYVPEQPASPKRLLIILLAAIIGFIFGVMIALIRNYWQAGKSHA
jgi:uncharacterized protein involved in exopolysaccharide biosynthesis